MTTPRRERLLQRFDATRPKVLSLDVFDTLLWRPFERPTDVFVEVHKVLGRIADCPLPESPRIFAAMRVAAEQAARRAHPTSEITIDEIARELSRVLGGRPRPELLVDAEVEAERAFIRLDPDVAALIRHASSAGVPYVLVSDMYLRAEHILELLRDAIARSSDPSHLELPMPERVYVSGERRANKGGRMFDIVLDELGRRPSEVLHVGDNERSDVEAPASKGLPSLHFRRETSLASRILDAEERYVEPSHLRGHYDCGLRTLRAKALASAQAGQVERFDTFDYGAFVLGPILTLFAEWVVEDCVRNGQRSVFCLMREGHLLAPLVQQAARARGVELEAKPLWVSRYAIRAASYRHANEAELRGYFVKRRSVPLDAVARDLGLDVAALRAAAGIHHGRALAEGERDRVIEAIVSSRALRDRVLETSAENRRRLFEYFERSGVFEHERLSIVDLGWGGTIQRVLAEVFRERARPREVRGLYLSTHEKILELPLESCTAASFLFHLGQPSWTCGFLRRTPEILEQACMPLEGSFRGVGEQGEILTFPQAIPEAQLRDVAEIQRGVFHFADLWLPGSAERRRSLSHADWEGVVARLRAIVARSLQEPTLEEARLFEDWVHDDNDGSARSDHLLGSPALRERARFMTYAQIYELTWLDCYWPQGLARLVGKEPGRRPAGRVMRTALGNDAVRAAISLYARSAVAVSRILR